MKLLVVNWQDRLNPHAGGAETHIHETFGRLALRGHEVHLLVSGWPGAARGDTLDGIRIHRTGGRHTFAALARSHYNRDLRSEGYDLVIEALNKVPVFAPLWSGRPTVLLVHHLFGATAFREATFPVAAATWVLERALPLAYRHVPAQAISESTAADLVRRGLPAQQIRVIHPGVDTQFFTPGGARAKRPLFVYIGRLRRYKRVDLLLKALARVRQLGVDAQVQIAGRGEHEPRLRQLAARLRLEEHVEFVGWVTEEQKRMLLRQAWGHVFPSPNEGWGITNVEAAACGTPSIASDAPGLRDSVSHERSGILVRSGDVDALTAALRRLGEDSHLVERLGRGAREFAEGLTWEHTAVQTEEHLQRVLRSS